MTLSEAQQVAQRNRGTLFVEDGEVLSTTEYAGKQFIQRIHAPKTAAAATPGSFVHVSCDDAIPMRRPLSIMRAQDGWIEVLYKIVGDGLTHLAKRKNGDSISLIGPIGQGFSLDPDYPRALLIGGGVGIPPMVFVADALRDNESISAYAILGSEIPFPFELAKSRLPFAGASGDIDRTMPLLENWNVPTRLASNAGFDGCLRGFVTDLAREHLQALPEAEQAKVKIYSCGPTPMLKAVSQLATEFGLPCEVSLEEFMACAVGGCAGCAVAIQSADGTAMKRVCVDGPVFDAATVAW